MTKVAVLKQDGSQAAELELNDAVFAIEPNNAVITDATRINASRYSCCQEPFSGFWWWT